MPALRELAPFGRAGILANLASRMRGERDEIARLISLEAAKPIRDAEVEADRGIFTVETAAEEAKRIDGEVLPLDLLPSSKGRFGIVRRFPIGPIAAISPFNFPLNLALHKLAPAIASGNSIVLKVPSNTPLTMLKIATLLDGLGLPDGAVSILPMNREVGDRLVDDDRFKLLSFTGSPDVGWSMKSRAGMKKVVLELGGNAGVLIDEDADLAFAASRVRVGAFAYAGQVCISVQRVFIHERRFDLVRVGVGGSVTVVDEVQRVVDASPGHGGVGGFLGEVVAGQDQAPVVGCALGFVDRRRVPVGEVPVGGVVERDRDRLVVVSATPHDLSVGVYGVNGRSCAVQ